MKFLKSIAVIVLSFMSVEGFAQMVKDNSVWTFEAIKKSADQYDIVAHLKLEKGWHVYSMKPGGDGTLIPVSIQFDKTAGVKLIGNVKEKGQLITEKLEGVDGKVNMYKGKVNYTQQAAIKAGTAVTGRYEYQICNDRMCLPPTTKTFKIAVK